MGKLDVAVGDKIYFNNGEKRPYTVRARNERFIICTKPFNARKTVIYTIIDLERNVRGTDNLIFGMGYETDDQIKESMQLLQNHCDNKHTETIIGWEGIKDLEVNASMEVSYRNYVNLDVLRVVKAQPVADESAKGQQLGERK